MAKKNSKKSRMQMASPVKSQPKYKSLARPILICIGVILLFLVLTVLFNIKGHAMVLYGMNQPAEFNNVLWLAVRLAEVLAGILLIVRGGHEVIWFQPEPWSGFLYGNGKADRKKFGISALIAGIVLVCLFLVKTPPADSLPVVVLLGSFMAFAAMLFVILGRSNIIVDSGMNGVIVGIIFILVGYIVPLSHLLNLASKSDLVNHSTISNLQLMTAGPDGLDQVELLEVVMGIILACVGIEMAVNWKGVIKSAGKVAVVFGILLWGIGIGLVLNDYANHSQTVTNLEVYASVMVSVIGLATFLFQVPLIRNLFYRGNCYICLEKRRQDNTYPVINRTLPCDHCLRPVCSGHAPHGECSHCASRS